MQLPTNYGFWVEYPFKKMLAVRSSSEAEKATEDTDINFKLNRDRKSLLLSILIVSYVNVNTVVRMIPFL